MIERLRIHKFKILAGILGVLVFVGAVFGAYKFGQRQIQLAPQPNIQGERVFCQNPRPEVCTLEQVMPPTYICGSDGESHGNKCQACADREVDWYIIQNAPCSR